jgi:hypothetical protein
MSPSPRILPGGVVLTGEYPENAMLTWPSGGQRGPTKLEWDLAQHFLAYDPRQRFPKLAGGVPLVLYFPTAKDAADFWAIFKEAFPSAQTHQLPP